MTQELSANFSLPESVLNYVHSIFAATNDHISTRISKFPNAPEESLDISFIEKLSEYAGPVAVDLGWAVQIATHFIGSIRHHRRYEIADIGVVIVFKKNSKVVGRKLILLQSKRLYPENFRVIELDDFDYARGLGMIVREASNEVPVTTPVTYEFSINSKYGALRKASEQCDAIQGHFDETRIPVHYMMYNPLVLPWAIDHPLVLSGGEFPARSFGTRIIDAGTVHTAMYDAADNSPLKISDLLPNGGFDGPPFGRSLEDFFYEAVSCREGFHFISEKDEGIRKLFNRKSGPIFCIVEITIEKSLSV